MSYTNAYLESLGYAKCLRRAKGEPTRWRASVEVIVKNGILERGCAALSDRVSTYMVAGGRT